MERDFDVLMSHSDLPSKDETLQSIDILVASSGSFTMSVANNDHRCVQQRGAVSCCLNN